MVVFALLWLPVHIFLLLIFFYSTPSPHYRDAVDAVYVLCTGLAYFNSCVNPIIYNRTSKDFRDAFRAAVGCKKRAKDDEEGGGGGGIVAAQLQAAPKTVTVDADCADGKIHVEEN